MRIYSKAGIVIFAVLVTLVAMVSAISLNYVVFPSSVLPQTLPGTFVIVILVTIPICLFLGGKIRENTQLALQLQRLVDRDRLTDVATRDYFFTQMKMTPKAYGTSLMVDIDHFKAVNDTYGHMIGDIVIQRVASALKGCVRKQDIVCRFGGEEFVVFLFDHDPAQGFRIAERMRTAVAALVTHAADANIGVTLSIGGSLKDAVASIDRTLQEADEALYRAKGAGRNRTVFSEHLLPIGSVPMKIS